MKQYKKGFTLIELLVVIAIIGILSTLATVSLGSARTKARDSKRVSDVSNIQTALEIYNTDQSGYPAAVASGVCTAGVNTLEGCCLVNGAGAGGGWKVSTDALCSGANRLVTVPNDPRNSAAGIDDYIYTQSATSYSILLNLESGAGSLAKDLVCAKPSGTSNVATAAACTP